MINIFRSALRGKFILLYSSLLLLGASLSAAEPAGRWAGHINLRGLEIRLFFNVEKDASGKYYGSFSSPEQGIRDMPISSINKYPNGILKFIIQDSSAEFSGKFEGNQTLKGTFSQGGTDFPVELKPAPAGSKNPDKSICGIWEGNMHASGKFLDAELEISIKDDQYFANFSVPQTSPNSMPIFDMEKSEEKISFAMPYMKASFTGKISSDGNSIEGFLEQFGIKNQIKLKRQQAK